MSGTPTELEIQAQWRAAVDVLETLRATVDGSLAGAGGKLDVLVQSLEGEFTPSGLSAFGTAVRDGASGLLSASLASAAITPILYEYARILPTGTDSQGYGSTYQSLGDLFSAIRQWFLDTSKTVESRAITFDTSVTAGGSNIGNGTLSRLTVDSDGFPLEACHVERKQLRCRADVNTNAQQEAEVFEIAGEPSSPDNVLWGSYGSGDASRRLLVSRHAGSSQGGSFLNNSSFSTYSATATPKFAAWTETAGGGQLAQDTTNYYRSHPGASVPAALRVNGGGGTVTLTQPLTAMRARRLDPNTPHFLRVMVNPTVGSAVGGTLTLRLGSQTATLAVASMASGWQELCIAVGTACWPRSFMEADLAVEIEWSSSTSGYLLIDDAIFTTWDLVDGTWWLLRGAAASHTPWALDDILAVTDTGGALGTGKIQEWLVRAGFGCLPSSGTPTFADP